MNILVAPLAWSDRPFVFSVCHAIIVKPLFDQPALGCDACEKLPPRTPPCPAHRHLDRPYVQRLTNELIANCQTRVATVPEIGDEHSGKPEIQGFVVEDPRDATIEFAHLRETFRELKTGPLAVAIMKALVDGRSEVVMRRQASHTTMDALRGAVGKVVVRPRGIG
jgi:hypothetical protein